VVEDVLSLIENIQFKLYSYFNNRPENWLEEVEKIVFDKATDSNRDANYAFDFIKKYHTTKYQDPLILGGILTPWDLVVSNLEGLFKGKDLNKVNEILLASIPIPMLNGLATIDKKNKCAILFQDGLRFWPTNVSHFLFELLFVEENKRFLKIKNENLYDHVLSNKVNSHNLLSLLYLDVVHEGLRRVHDSSYLKNRDRKLIIEQGFKAFVCSHELAHYLYGHCDQLVKETNIMFRNSSYLSNILSKSNLKYTDLDEEHVINFMHKQLLENLADMKALHICLRIAGKYNKLNHNEGLLFLLGSLSFFWYLESSERMVKAVDTKGESLGSISYRSNNDFDIENLLNRSSHPAPLSRFKGALGYLAVDEVFKSEFGADDLESLLMAQESIDLLFSYVWECYMPDIRTEILKNNLPVHKKWSIGLNDFVGLGLDKSLI